MNVITGSHRPIKMWTEGVEVEDAAKQQLINTASMHFETGSLCKGIGGPNVSLRV